MTNKEENTLSSLASINLCEESSWEEDFVVVHQSTQPLLAEEKIILQRKAGPESDDSSSNSLLISFFTSKTMTTVRGYLQAKKQYLPTVLLSICVIFYLPYSYVTIFNSKEQHLKDILAHSGFQKISNRSHVLFSAYLDDRFPGEAAKIRILGFKNRDDSQPLYCKLYFQNNEAICLNDPAIELSLEEKGSGNLDVEYMFHCTLPPQATNVPVAVTLSSAKNCLSHDHAVPVHLLQGNTEAKKEIAVCFSSPGNKLTSKNKNEIQEILELCKHFGASTVEIYNESMHVDLLDSLKDYIKSGFLNIRDWNLNNRNLPKLAQALSINDCIYRNMRLFKNIVFVNKDEIIIPSSGFKSSWLSLIKQMRKVNPGIGAFWFQEAIYVTKEGLIKTMTPSPLPPKCPLENIPTNKLPRLFTHRFVSHPKTKSSRDNFKQFIVDPSVVLYVDVDKAVTLLPGKSSTYLPTEFGQGMHFLPYESVKGNPAVETFRSKDRIKLALSIYKNLDFTPKVNLSECWKMQ